MEGPVAERDRDLEVLLEDCADEGVRDRDDGHAASLAYFDRIPHDA